jgi:hypothetical protein
VRVAVASQVQLSARQRFERLGRRARSELGQDAGRPDQQESLPYHIQS